MNWISWKGEKSILIDGLMICELPPITKPRMRYRETFIDGVDGSVIEELGYESYVKEVLIALKGNFKIDEVIDYFTGSGQLILSNEEEKYYNATIVERIDFERLIRFRKAKVKFIVQPYKFMVNMGELSINPSLGSYTINNRGNVKAKPILRLKGSGLVEFKQDGLTIFTYTFPQGENEVVIDSEQQDAYLGAVLKNRNMNGNFIELNVGLNNISWSGDLTEITVDKWGRWL